MDLAQLANLGEFVGGVAVLVTLIYLVVQVRQNTRTIRSTAVQSSNARILEVASLWGRSPENADVFRRGLDEGGELSESEHAHFQTMVSAMFMSMDSMFWDRENGILPDAIWEREWNVLLAYLARPGVRRLWEELFVSEPFRRYVTARIDAL